MVSLESGWTEIPYTHVRTYFREYKLSRIADSEKSSRFRKVESAIFYFAHILCKCTSQYECNDVLDGFFSPGDGCRSDTGRETVPGQFSLVIIFGRHWDSFAKMCTSRKQGRIYTVAKSAIYLENEGLSETSERQMF